MSEFFFGNLHTFTFSINVIKIIVISFVIISLMGTGFIAGKFFSKFKLQKIIREERKKAVKQSRAIIGGQCAENFAPFFPDFPGDPSEAHFLGRPVDYIVFKDSSKEEISEIIFVEIKTGKSLLTKTEKALKDAVINKKVSWKEIRINKN